MSEATAGATRQYRTTGVDGVASRIRRKIAGIWCASAGFVSTCHTTRSADSRPDAVSNSASCRIHRIIDERPSAVWIWSFDSASPMSATRRMRPGVSIDHPTRSSNRHTHHGLQYHQPTGIEPKQAGLELTPMPDTSQVRSELASAHTTRSGLATWQRIRAIVGSYRPGSRATGRTLALSLQARWDIPQAESTPALVAEAPPSPTPNATPSSKADSESRALTLATPLWRYLKVAAAFDNGCLKSEAHRGDNERRARYLERYFGSECLVATITVERYKQYAIARRSGGIKGRRVRTRSIRDLLLLTGAMRRATTVEENGAPLLARHPLPRSRSPPLMRVAKHTGRRPEQLSRLHRRRTWFRGARDPMAC
jgi:hypothetical protein